MAKTVFMKRDGVEYGPFEFNEVQDMLRNGGFKPEDQMRDEGGGAWKPAATFLKALGFGAAIGVGGFLIGSLMSQQTAEASVGTAADAMSGTAADSTSAFNPTMTDSVDVDHDGVADVESYDVNGDGVTDVNLLADRNGDGLADVGLDTNNDGAIDVAFADTNGDGLVDTQFHDTNLDGIADTVAVDTNADGIMDSVAEMSADGEIIAESGSGIAEAVGGFLSDLFS